MDRRVPETAGGWKGEGGPVSEWQPIDTAPKDGTKVDLWLHIYASPRSFGMEDDFRVTDAWWQDGKWVHRYRDKDAEIFSDYITHWMPLPEPPK